MATIETITVGNTIYNIAESGYSISDIYSTTEKVVGTWIDGKPIYQKTIVWDDRSELTFTSTTESSYTVDTILKKEFNNNELDKVISILCIAPDGTKWEELPRHHSTAFPQYAISAFLNVGSGNLALTGVSIKATYIDKNRYFPVYWTLKYTKSAD